MHVASVSELGKENLVQLKEVHSLCSRVLTEGTDSQIPNQRV